MLRITIEIMLATANQIKLKLAEGDSDINLYIELTKSVDDDWVKIGQLEKQQ